MHRVADDVALTELAHRFGLRAPNLRHLAGLFAGNCAAPEHVNGWRLEKDVQFLLHESDADGSRVVPVIGTPQQFHAYCLRRANCLLYTSPSPRD